MDSYDTSTLAGVVREFDQFEPFLLSMFFTQEINFETSSIDFDAISDDMLLAPFVSPMVAGKANKAQGQELRKFKPAYVKPKDVVDPERALRRAIGEAIGSGQLTGAQRIDAIIADLLDRQRQKIMRLKEWMAVRALLTGKIVVEGEDYPKVEVDFKRDAANTVLLAGGTAWDQLGTADPLGDIEAWAVLLEGPLTKLVFSKTAWNLFIKFQAVKDLLDTRRGSTTTLETGPAAGQFVSFKGLLGADIECWVYSGWYKDSTGTKVDYMPDNTVIASSPAVEGVRAHGAILDANANYQAMSLFPKMWQENDPAVTYVMSQSAPLMIPSRPNASVGATVK
jgi:hypothetical protein